MSLKIKIFSLAITVFLIILSCSEDDSGKSASAENKIESFTLTKGVYSQEFEVGDYSVSGTVESEILLENINLEVVISEGATISPDPNTITQIDSDFTLTVTSENGTERNYIISIDRALSDANTILEFRIDTNNLSTLAAIDNSLNTVTKRLPEGIDLSNLFITAQLPTGATMEPNIENISDFTSTVAVAVTSESGVQREYAISISNMDIGYSRTCEEINSLKWFGGDNRTDAPSIEPYDRNVGTGQRILLENDLSLSQFGIKLASGFVYRHDDSPYTNAVELKLTIRDVEGEPLLNTTAIAPSNFNGGWIDFDFSEEVILLEKDTPYHFQWYVINGAALGITSSSPALENETLTGFCYNGGLSGQSKISDNTNLEDSEVWFDHIWNFNIRLEGKI